MKILILLLSLVFCLQLQAKQKVCYETEKTKDGKQTARLTQESIDREAMLDQTIYSLIKVHMENEKSSSELQAELDRVRVGYCLEMFTQSVRDAFALYAKTHNFEGEYEDAEAFFSGVHKWDAAKTNGGWSANVSKQYEKAIYLSLSAEYKARKFSSSSAGLSEYTNPDKDQPVETAAEAEL